MYRAEMLHDGGIIPAAAGLYWEGRVNKDGALTGTTGNNLRANHM